MGNDSTLVTRKLKDNSNIEFRTGKGGWCGVYGKSYLTFIDPKYTKDLCELSISVVRYAAEIEKGMFTKPLQDALLASGIELGPTSSPTTWALINSVGINLYWYDNMGSPNVTLVSWDEWKWAWNIINGDCPQEITNSIDMNKFPHKCALCGNPAYRGFSNFEHATVTSCQGR
jgi:hypothetical protein